MLALSRRYGMARDDLAGILWPGRPLDIQRSNFRQSLAILRRALGDDALEVNRVHCQLRTSFPLITDYDSPDLRESPVFMPSQEGDWFEQLRLDSEPEEESLLIPSNSVVGHFINTLTWFAENDARGMFQMLRSSAPLARGVAYRDMLRLLNRATKDPTLAGWSAYWRGSSESDLEVCAKLLRFAFEEAKNQHDSALASEVCLELGKVYSRTGQFKKAEQICRIADAIASDTGSKIAISNATWLRGTVFSHWGENQSGLSLLEKGEDMAVDNVDRAIARSARAFYLVSAGRVEEGRQVLEWPKSLAASLGHSRLSTVTDMTQAVLGAYDLDRTSAVAGLESIVQRCRAKGNTQFEVYGKELIAKLYLLDGDKGLAAETIKSAKATRLAANMAITPLEAKRVDSVK